METIALKLNDIDLRIAYLISNMGYNTNDQ